MKNIQEKDIIEKLKLVKDPEIGIDVWTLGLIYKITIEKESIEILMTLTTAFCPFADELMADVEKQVGALGYPKGTVRVDLTFEPAWEPSAELRLMMGV
jgi:metal-sulfur cluster biosynthetic enzyme